MTLNIDLEDVPFAILEAVKARILRNRRLLDLYNQQNPQPSLRPGPQLVKQGASRKGWRLPKTAAMALGDERIVLISWRDALPVITDRQATPLYIDQVNQVASTINGVPAIANASTEFSLGQAVYEIKSFPRGASNFTLETWAQSGNSDFTGGIGSGSSGNNESLGGHSAYIQLIWQPGGEGTEVSLTGTHYPNGTTAEDPADELSPGFYIFVQGSFIGQADYVKVSDNPLQPYHLCIQRIGLAFYFYINGRLLFTKQPVPDKNQLIASPVYLYLVSQAFNDPAGNRVSQARLTTDRARYNSSGFTPQQLPFSLT